MVKVTGTTKGRGFQGVVKRHGFGGGPNTHGNTKHRAGLHRTGHRPVARHQGQEDARPVRERAAHADRNLRVEKIDAERNLIYIRGAWRGRPTASSSCASRAEPMTMRTRDFEAARSRRTARRVSACAAGGAVRRHVNVPVMHQVVKATWPTSARARASTKTRGRCRWQPEAVEAEGHRSRPSGLDARAELAGRWYGLRPDAAQLHADVPKPGARRWLARAR
jgi:hypothetical protein